MSAPSDTAVGDCEYFRTTRSLVVKELAFFDVENGYHCRWCFRPPYDFGRLSAARQKSAAWVVKNWHGMPWDSGSVSYRDLDVVLDGICASYGQVYTKGGEKKNFFQQRTGRTFNDLDDLLCPKMDDGPVASVSCPFHDSRGRRHCALQKAAYYAEFLKKEKKDANPEERDEEERLTTKLKGLEISWEEWM